MYKIILQSAANYDTIMYINNVSKGGVSGNMKKRILIGVIITDCHIDYQAEILRGIISQAFKSSCDTAVIAPLHNFSVDSPYKNAERSIFELILSGNFDGFIYDRNTFFSEEIRSEIDILLRKSGKPVMLLDYADHKSFETTSADDSAAFEEITDHLINVHGHRRIYCLTGPRGNFGAEERLNGYKNSMKKHGLPFDKTFCEYGDYWHSAADNYAERIISGKLRRPDAVVCGNDIMAVRLTNKLTAAGIKVPEDIAVTGFDASEAGYTSEPSITSYSRPNFQLGSEALRRLYRIITGRICSRIPNEKGALRLGTSCGCQEDKSVRLKTRRSRKLSSDLENQLLYGDMLSDITNVPGLDTFADRIDNYTYLIYKLSHFGIYLTRKYIDATLSDASFAGKLDFHIGDEMQTILSKTAVKRSEVSRDFFSSDQLIPEYSSERSYPVAYYISPLHYNNNFFGYSAVSFGKVPFSFSNIFIQWTNYVNVALEHIRIKSMMNNTIAGTGRSAPESTANPQYEKLVMLRNRIMKNPELPWNISDIAASLYLSKSYLQKIYKSYFNKSIIEEMIEFRIGSAKKLLSASDMTITEIARRCGYSSYNYFVRQFRLCEGVSPSEYRDNARKADKNES